MNNFILLEEKETETYVPGRYGCGSGTLIRIQKKETGFMIKKDEDPGSKITDGGSNRHPDWDPQPWSVYILKRSELR